MLHLSDGSTKPFYKATCVERLSFLSTSPPTKCPECARYTPVCPQNSSPRLKLRLKAHCAWHHSESSHVQLWRVLTSHWFGRHMIKASCTYKCTAFKIWVTFQNCKSHALLAEIHVGLKLPVVSMCWCSKKNCLSNPCLMKNIVFFKSWLFYTIVRCISLDIT